MRTLSLAIASWILTFGSTCAAPKNILFISVDDLRPELNLYGAEHISSPHIDRLGEEGAWFSSAYCNSPQCGPSRASVMTGLRPGENRFFSRKGAMPAGHISKEVPRITTLPGALKANGYETICLGKVYHVFNDDADSWTKPPWKVGDKRHWHRIREAFHSDEGIATLQIPQKGKPISLPWEAADVPDNAYPDGMIADRAIKELEELSSSDKPFLLAVGFLRPHLPLNAPQKHWDLYPEESIKLPDFMQLPEGAPNEADYDWAELRRYIGIPKNGPLSENQAKTMIRAYYACVSYIDAQVGRLMDALEANGLADNTLVVLWGDHGWNLGEHGFWCKHTTFETSLRVPLIFQGPGVVRGERPQFAELIDIYPTLLEYAGVKLPPHNEGVSLWPELREPHVEGRQFTYSYWKRGLSAKDASHRLTYWPKSGASMLYDHINDPDETVNRSSDPQYTEAYESLKQHLSNFE